MSLASLATFERPRIGVANTVFKSGPLCISSKGIGWKSWKKRWFILTRTSLVFFKNDPSALSQRGGEVNMTLGGIDLNNSGSVVVREDKKLLTVLFPDGRDGRAFTLKAETSEDLYEWKTALEHALAQAPSAALAMGHNGIFRNDIVDGVENSAHQWRDKRSVKSLVVGRPILLALEDIDGGPSFLEKALRFLETFGTQIEGILRQSADVEEVDRRVLEYEHGKNDFSSDEDAHIVGDCVKHILRELPSSPVPASCCTALLEAYRIERKDARLNALRCAILETFPEPNRRLLQRVLKMMHTIASHASVNRMNPSAVAACMAPLLLRPLLAGECEMEDDFDMNDDSSAQLLAAANAANNAQAIITTLLEEYDNIFDDESLQRCSVSADSRIGNSDTEDVTDEETMVVKDNGYHPRENEVDGELDVDAERVLSGKLSETSGYVGSDLYDYKAFRDDSDAESSIGNQYTATHPNQRIDNNLMTMDANAYCNGQDLSNNVTGDSTADIDYTVHKNGSHQWIGEVLHSEHPVPALPVVDPESSSEKSTSKSSGSYVNVKRSTLWGRNMVRKNLSMESIDSSGEEELAIQRLEITKNDLRNRIAKEAKGNAILQASLERRKQALHERRSALEQDVSRLQEQLEAERDLRAALEVGLSMSALKMCSSHMDSKTRGELEEIALAEADVAKLKQKVAELHHQLSQQRQHQYGSLCDASDRLQHIQNLHSQQKFLQQDFDTKLAFCNHEKKKNEESSSGSNWRKIKGQFLQSASNGRHPTRKQFADSPSVSDSRSTEATTSVSVDELSGIDSAAMPSTSREAESRQGVEYQRQHPSTGSSALVELTTRLDFFKERRSQLMEQLHNLDTSYKSPSPSRELLYKQSSPPWS